MCTVHSYLASGSFFRLAVFCSISVAIVTATGSYAGVIGKYIESYQLL
jgi:hypothetical protein